jgi:putative sterol carrier protein
LNSQNNKILSKKEVLEMTEYIYPGPEWLEDSKKAFDADTSYEEKLKKLTGGYCFQITAEPEWGIDKDAYIFMGMDAGKMTKFCHVSEDQAKKDSEYIMGATPQTWKRILKKKAKFVGQFMMGKVKLVQGNTVGALALGPYSGTLVNVLTLVDLKFPDELQPDELEKFKTAFTEFRANAGV